MKENKILVTGGSGLVGTALKRVIPDAIFVSSADCDLRNQQETFNLFNTHMPTRVIHLAAKVGGIAANLNYLADFYTDNIQINTNVLAASHYHEVKKVISLLSTCVYPDNATYPLTEEQIHDGRPHSSNYAYAYAKRMLDVHSRAYRDQHGNNYITAIPNNLYGENDNFHLMDSHVIPAIIRKVHEAKMFNKPHFVLWGSGNALREFTYSKDLANILLFLLNTYDGSAPINIGNNREISIKFLAEMISDIMQYKGDILWDTSKPEGQYRKPSSNKNLIKLGWDPKSFIDIRKGLKKTCEWYIMNYPSIRGV